MKDSIIVYYDTERDADIKKMIDELMKIEDSLYFKRRSRSEVAKLVLVSGLKEEIKRYKKVKKN